MRENGPVAPVACAARLAVSLEFLLERLDHGGEVGGELEDGRRRQHRPGPIVLVVREQVRHAQPARQSTLRHLDARHQIEPEQRKVREVVVRERFVIQVGVHEPDPRQPVPVPTSQIRQKQPARVADNHRRHAPAAFEQEADLALDFPRDFRQGSRELRCDDAVGARTTPPQSPERPQLRRLQTAQIAAKQGRSSPRRMGIPPMSRADTLRLHHDAANDALTFDRVQRPLRLAQFVDIELLEFLP